MVKTENVPFLRTLPRLEELQLKNIWPKYQKDKEFLKYFPDIDEDKTPSRAYFFQILSAIKPDDFKDLLNNTESKRKDKLDDKNQIVNINTMVWEEISGTRYGETFDTSQASKRISVNKKKRKEKTNN